MVPFLFVWSERRDSNSRPSPWQGDALPAELLSLLVHPVLGTSKISIPHFLQIKFAQKSTRDTDPFTKSHSIDQSYFHNVHSGWQICDIDR